MDLSQVRADLAAGLAATGIRVTLEARHATPPCILVGPITQVRVAGLCAWELEIPVWLIAPAPGDAQAVDWLAEHVTDVMEACGTETEAVLGSTSVGGQGDLPSYEITSTTYTRET